MTVPFLLGIAGSLVLVAGAAYPDTTTKHPARSTKNWLLAAGALLMLLYSILNYFEGGAFFFILLQAFVNVASIFMMGKVSDRISAPVLACTGIGLILWALFLFEDASTMFFILGLTGIGIGYAMKNGTVRRALALTLGSALIALFSYIDGNWIFFWLNVFFAIFSGYYAVSRLQLSAQR